MSNYLVRAFTVALVIFALLCMPAYADEESIDEIAGEVSEHAEELFNLSAEILQQTKCIVKDESVDQDIRDLAKSIHLVSHELEDIADNMKEEAALIQTLAADPAANRAEIEEAISKIEADCADFDAKLSSKHEDIHDLVFNAPESREENADLTHDAAHEAADVSEHMLKHVQELKESLDTSSAPAVATSQSVSSADLTCAIDEIKEHSEELFTLSAEILQQTKCIVKDESVDQDIRDLAKSIHMVSHELEDIADNMKEEAEKIETLAANPAANRAEIEEAISKIECCCTDFDAKLSSKHEEIHDLVFNAPESREENADATHDAAHEAADVSEHLQKHVQELKKSLDAPSAPEKTVAENAPAKETEKTAPKATASPGFGLVLALGALFAVACGFQKVIR